MRRQAQQQQQQQSELETQMMQAEALGSAAPMVKALGGPQALEGITQA
jgi:hypothetical protein